VSALRRTGVPRFHEGRLACLLTCLLICRGTMHRAHSKREYKDKKGTIHCAPTGKKFIDDNSKEGHDASCPKD